MKLLNELTGKWSACSLLEYARNDQREWRGNEETAKERIKSELAGDSTMQATDWEIRKLADLLWKKEAWERKENDSIYAMFMA